MEWSNPVTRITLIHKNHCKTHHHNNLTQKPPYNNTVIDCCVLFLVVVMIAIVFVVFSVLYSLGNIINSKTAVTE